MKRLLSFRNILAAIFVLVVLLVIFLPREFVYHITKISKGIQKIPIKMTIETWIDDDRLLMRDNSKKYGPGRYNIFNLRTEKLTPFHIPAKNGFEMWFFCFSVKEQAVYFDIKGEWTFLKVGLDGSSKVLTGLIDRWSCQMLPVSALTNQWLKEETSLSTNSKFTDKDGIQWLDEGRTYYDVNLGRLRSFTATNHGYLIRRDHFDGTTTDQQFLTSHKNWERYRDKNMEYYLSLEKDPDNPNGMVLLTSTDILNDAMWPAPVWKFNESSADKISPTALINGSAYLQVFSNPFECVGKCFARSDVQPLKGQRYLVHISGDYISSSKKGLYAVKNDSDSREKFFVQGDFIFFFISPNGCQVATHPKSIDPKVFDPETLLVIDFCKTGPVAPRKKTPKH